MIDIAVEYPFMLFKRKAVGKSPTKWEELTEKQFIALSKIVHGIAPDYKFLAEITGIAKRILIRLSPFQLLLLSQSIDFIGKAGSSHYDFLIPEIKCNSRKLFSPQSKMEGVTFGQFIFLDAFYSDWSTLNKESSLDKFIAVLYLPQSQQFNNKIIEENAQQINKLGIDLRKAIAFNYSLIIFWLQKAYPLIFPETHEEQPQEGTPKPSHKSAWLKIFESLVGEDLINRDKYADLPLHTVLKYMTRKYKENAKH